MYVIDSMQAYKVQIKKEADCEEAIWGNITTQTIQH